MKRKPVVFVAALDWGLGHATRVIPIIDYFLEQGWEVWIGGKGDALALLKRRYPFLKWINIPSYTVGYAGRFWQILYFLFRLPVFLYWNRREHILLRRAFMNNEPDLIVSDNRYGFYLKDIPSVLISHQLRPELPRPLFFLKKFAYRQIARYIRHFEACWVPDFKGERSLSGRLSQLPKMNTVGLDYLGPLSRFMGLKTGKPDTKYDGMLLLSGPEPHRSGMKQTFIQQALQMPSKKFLVVEGDIHGSAGKEINIDIVPVMDTTTLYPYFISVPLLICRSGYSTIMDLAATGRKAVLIPTPGQPEQVYLARYLNDKGAFAIQSQQQFDLQQAFEEQGYYTGIEKVVNHEEMKAVVDAFIRKNRVLKKQ